jgi:hypothetical protein
VPAKSGGEVTLPFERAVAAYLRVLRNAGHAFGGRADAARAPGTKRC